MEGKKESTARAPPHSPLSVPVRYVIFRILCHESRVAYVIGKQGSMITQLKESTECNICVEEGPPDSAYSLINIVADVGLTSIVKLGEQEEEVQVSRAQHALIRVFEASNRFRIVGTASCMLLTKASSLTGALIELIKKETGCNIQVLQDDLPCCADSDDVVVRIQGNVSAVKIALVYISSRLQDCQRIVNTMTAGSRSSDKAFQTSLHRKNEVVPRDALHRTMDVVTREASYRSPQHREVNPLDSFHRHVDISQQEALATSFESLALDAYQRSIGTITQETLSQPRKDSFAHRTSVHSLSASAPEYHPVTVKQQPLPASKDNKQQVVLILLCSNQQASSVIGQGGSTIRDLQSETGVSISVGDTFSDCDERLITITSSENLIDGNSPAQRAIALVFSRFYEGPIEHKKITARLVVPSNQIGGLVGKSGSTIYKLQKSSGAFIQVLCGEHIPRYVAENNHQVVEMSGWLPHVKAAINYVTSKLLNNLASSSTGISRPVDADPRIRPQYPFTNRFTPTAGYAPNVSRRSTMDLNDIYHLSSLAPSRSRTPAAPRGEYDGRGGLPSTRAGLGLDSGLKSSNVTNPIVEFRVPEDAVNFICSHNGLQELRQVSGARIIVREPSGGTRDRIIDISGTPDQIQSVQNMLQALFL